MNEAFLPPVKAATGCEILQRLGRGDMQAVMAGILINTGGLLRSVSKHHGMAQTGIGRGKGATGQGADGVDAASVLFVKQRATHPDVRGCCILFDIGCGTAQAIFQGIDLWRGEICRDVGGDQVGDTGRDTDKQVAAGAALIATGAGVRVGEALAQKGGGLFEYRHGRPGGISKRIGRIKGAVQFGAEIGKHLFVAPRGLGRQGAGLGDVARNPVYCVIKLGHQSQLLSCWSLRQAFRLVVGRCLI